MRVDENFVGRAQSGDPEAFERALGPCLRPALELAYLMLGSKSAAEDVVQDAAVTAWRKIGNVHPERGFRGWFLAIVANRCRRHRRRAWTRLVVLSGDVAVQPTEAHASDFDLVRALGRLSIEERAAIALHYYVDLPVSEVAAILGLSMAGAKSRIHRSLNKLRSLLQGSPEVSTT